MSSYGQFCPMAKAAEILCERWSLLVVRELTAGSRHFNDLRRGVPLMSPSLLSRRLKQLEAAGVVAQTQDEHGIGYDLTPAGADLQPLVELMAGWGSKWVRRRLSNDDLDAGLLMSDGAGEIALAFEFLGKPGCSVLLLDMAVEIVPAVDRENVGMVIEAAVLATAGYFIDD